MTHGGARPLVAALIALALAGACQPATVPTPSAPGSPAASPSAAPPAPASTPSLAPASPEPTVSPTTPPEAQAYQAVGEPGDVLFAPDGRIVVVARDFNANRAQVAMLDESGAVLAGWPWSPGGTGSPIATAALGPAGSVYVAVRTSRGDPEAYSWTLHRLDAAANEMTGFPVILPAGPFCALAASPDGLAYTACETESGDAGPGTATFSAIRPDGSMAAGWPVTRKGSPTVVGFLPGGALVAWLGSGGGMTLVAIRQDGSLEPGWPITSPKDGGSVTIDGAGRVWIASWAWSEGQCGPATATTYTVLAADGTRLPGWPVQVKGWASDPLVADDGSMTIVTEGGKALRYGLDGAAIAGWAASKVSVDVSCYGGSTPVDVDDGGTLVIGGKATLLDAAGAVAPGWPATLSFDIARSCPDCTPGPNAPLDPAIGADGIYVGAYGNGPRVIALGRDGSVIEGVSRVIGKEGDLIDWVRIAPSGRVWTLLRRSVDESATVTLVPVAQDRVPTR